MQSATARRVYSTAAFGPTVRDAAKLMASCDRADGKEDSNNLLRPLTRWRALPFAALSAKCVRSKCV